MAATRHRQRPKWRASLAECLAIIAAIMAGVLMLPGWMTLLGLWLGAAVAFGATVGLLALVWVLTSPR